MDGYWNGKGVHQADYDRLFNELVPSSGASETREGELLRAVSKIGYDCTNNGFGNNWSGALRFLELYLPDFNDEWYQALAPYACGIVHDNPDEALPVCEAMTDAVVSHVVSVDGKYSPNPCDMFDLTVKATGLELEDEEYEEYEDFFDDMDDEEEEDDLDAESSPAP